MASISRSKSRDPSTLFQKLDPSLQTSLLQKMHQIDFFEDVVARIFRINQLLEERLTAFKLGAITLHEITHVYPELCEKNPSTASSPKRLAYYQSHLVSVLQDFYRCDLSQNETLSKEKIQQSLQTCIQQYEARIEDLKRAISKASAIRDALLLEIQSLDNYLTSLGKQYYPADIPVDKTTINAIANTYLFLIEDYSPVMNA